MIADTRLPTIFLCYCVSRGKPRHALISIMVSICLSSRPESMNK